MPLSYHDRSDFRRIPKRWTNRNLEEDVRARGQFELSPELAAVVQSFKR
ncbi:hypothetical protein WKW80_25005 [Variovorax humicola]|uniref:Uncharacterized protein n=1 Tax=Variovorax humicola TaxID=1769758 RepID=A0ABU8W7I4_9BURK